MKGPATAVAFLHWCDLFYSSIFLISLFRFILTTMVTFYVNEEGYNSTLLPISLSLCLTAFSIMKTHCYCIVLVLNNLYVFFGGHQKAVMLRAPKWPAVGLLSINTEGADPLL